MVKQALPQYDGVEADWSVLTTGETDYNIAATW